MNTSLSVARLLILAPLCLSGATALERRPVWRTEPEAECPSRGRQAQPKATQAYRDTPRRLRRARRPQQDRRFLATGAKPVAALDVPFVPQRKDTCGAASLAMVMRYWQADVHHDEIAATLLQPQLKGILGSRLAAYAQEKGFRALAYAGDLSHARAYIQKGRPLIVALALARALGRDRYHNVVVVGFDLEEDAVVINDPARGEQRRMALKDFERQWAAADHWTLLVLPGR